MALHKPSSKKPSHHSHLSASNDLLKMSTTALTKQPSSRLSLSKIRSSATLVPQKSAICMKAHAIEEVKETEEDEEEVRKEDVGEDGFKAAWNGPNMRAWREDMLNERYCSYCLSATV